METLYYSFLYPHLCYCIEVWGNTFNCHTDPLFKLQKKAIRIITCSSKFAHTTELFNQLKMLRLDELYLVSVQMFMYKFYNNKLPDIFNEFFQRNVDVHQHYTRQSQMYHPPFARLTHTKRNIRFMGVKTDAILSPVLTYIGSYHFYKRELKTLLLSGEGVCNQLLALLNI